MNDRQRGVFLACVGTVVGLTLVGCVTMGSAKSRWSSFGTPDGAEIYYRHWRGTESPRAAVQIVHGAAERSGRYDRFAQALVREGYAVYATDHRGHGRTRVRSGQLGDAGPDAWNHFIDDEQALTQLIRLEHPGVKLVMIGHSLGSFSLPKTTSRDMETRSMPSS